MPPWLLGPPWRAGAGQKPPPQQYRWLLIHKKFRQQDLFKRRYIASRQLQVGPVDNHGKAATAKEEARAALEAQRAQRDETIQQAQANAEEIEAKARDTAERLKTQSAEAKEESDRMILERENEMRLRKIELDRIETEIREQADSYAMRVYREADEYRRTSERRALDLERQAQEILDQAKNTAGDISKNALEDARRNLANALDLVNTIFSDVSGSMSEVGRIRQLLGDSVERIRDQQLPAFSQEAFDDEPETMRLTPGTLNKSSTAEETA